MSTREMFDRISPQYDLANRVLSFGLDLHWRRSLSLYLPPSQDLHVLDVATGTGDQLRALFEKKAPIKMAIGIDISEGMLKVARQKLEKCSYKDRVTFQQADAEDLPFEDNTFDLSTMSFGIRNMVHPMTSLQEIHRVTKPGGCCLILEFSLPKNLFRRPYLFYLRTLLPRIGGLIARDFAAYRYLNKTIESFACGETFLSWMRQAGWSRPSATPLLFGSVTLYRGEKE
jgi:demethylmenaquinone methyltransferase/2-methoxy-6-polyprenyl-1,4-benzoquinol methylase